MTSVSTSESSILSFPRFLRNTAATSSIDWKRARLYALVAYLVSRLFVLAGGAIAVTTWALQDKEEGKPAKNGLKMLIEYLDMWDGHWYLEVVRNGYPRVIQPDVTYFVSDARAAFFPLYPRLVHFFDLLLPGGPVWVSLLLNIILGGVFIYLAGRIALVLFNAKVAERTMVLLCLFPGSFVLSFAYSEAIMLCLAALCLLALVRHAWVYAGVFALLAGLARPNGIALCLACAIACLIAIKERREYSSLIAPLLAPWGYIGFMLFLRHHTNEPWAWFRVQNEAWQESTSFGGTAVIRTFDFFRSPFSSPTSLITAASLFVTVFLLYAARKHKLPSIFFWYSIGILVLMLIPATVTARPRFLYTAFPLFISVAAMLRDEDDRYWTLLVASLSAGLVFISALYGVYGAIP